MEEHQRQISVSRIDKLVALRVSRADRMYKMLELLK